MDAKGDSKEDPVPGGGGDDDGGGDLIDELTSDNDYCDGAPDSDVEVGGDDAAPLPPEFIAASFEDEAGEKDVIVDDHIGAVVPGAEHGDRGGERGELLEMQEWAAGVEDDEEAPPPPEFIAASFEWNDDANQDTAKNPPGLIEDGDDSRVRAEPIDTTLEVKREIDSTRDVIDSLMQQLDEIPWGNFEISLETPADTESPERRLNPTPTSAAAILQAGAVGSPNLQCDDGQSLSRSGQDPNEEIAMPPTTEPMPPSRPNFDRSNQSLPLLEATCVDEIVAFRVIDTQDHDAQGWRRIPRKYKVVMLGVFFMATAAIVAVAVVGSQNERPEPNVVTGPVVVVSPETTIVGDAANDLFGKSVAVSADARTIVIGAPGLIRVDNSKKGYVKVHRINDDDGNRAQLGVTIDGDEIGDTFGWSVDITPDGTTIVIGSPGTSISCEKCDRPGYVRVFSLESDDDLGTDTWIQIGGDITGEADGNNMFGYFVSISDDGKTIAVGAHGCSCEMGENLGHVRVYRMDDFESDWIKIGDDIEGMSVSMSENGTIVAIGTPYGDVDEVMTGLVNVYRFDSEGSSWEPLGESIYGDNSNDNFGWSVDLSPDGNVVAIGSPAPDYEVPGYVRVFSLNSSDDSSTGTSWEKIGRDIIGEAIGDGFGCSVSLSDDGGTLAVGAENENGSGAVSGRVRVYRLMMVDDDNSWEQLGDSIDGEAAGDFSGVSVSLSADGNKVAIGSLRNDYNGDDSGQVSVYVLE
jgi:hypothetical protein